MANASLILFVSLVVLTAAKPFNNDGIEENPQPRGIQYRLPSLYELYDRYPELYPRQEYPRVLYQPSASIPEELYNGDILQRQPSEDREVAVIPNERLEQQDADPVEKNLPEPEKPSLDEKEQEKEVPNREQPENHQEEPQQHPDDEKDHEKEAPNREQPETPAEEPQQRPDDEKEQSKDDKHDDRPADLPNPKPQKPQKPGKEGDRPRGKPQKKPQDKRRPASPRRPLIKPDPKDLEVDAEPLAANPKPDTPLVQINVQVASL